MAKNAFEIRLDILQMAHSDENMRFLEKLNTCRSFDEKGTQISPSKEMIDILFPKTQDIIKRAEELYTFVEDKGL